MYTDPTGESAFAGALPIAGGAAAADGPFPVGDAVGLAILGGALLYDAFNDDATDDSRDKAARCRAKCSRILEENPHRPGGGYTGDSYTNRFHKCVQECNVWTKTMTVNR